MARLIFPSRLVASLSSGLALAQHADFSLVSETAPARPGETVLLYLAGLGLTDVPVVFSGLTLFSVGLYQLNLQIPAGLPDGPAQITVSQSGSFSNPVTLPIG